MRKKTWSPVKWHNCNVEDPGKFMGWALPQNEEAQPRLQFLFHKLLPKVRTNANIIILCIFR